MDRPAYGYYMDFACFRGNSLLYGKLLLALASTDILGSESRETHGHILLWETTNN
jgi:hypothetical protein